MAYPCFYDRIMHLVVVTGTPLLKQKQNTKIIILVYLTNWPYCNAKLFPVNKLMIFCSFHHCWIFNSLEFFCKPFLVIFTIKKYRNLYMIYIFIHSKTLFKLKMGWFALTFLHTPVKWCVSSTLFSPFPTHNISLKGILAERCT